MHACQGVYSAIPSGVIGSTTYALVALRHTQHIHCVATYVYCSSISQKLNFSFLSLKFNSRAL